PAEPEAIERDKGDFRIANHPGFPLRLPLASAYIRKANYTCVRDEPDMKILASVGLDHDKSVRKSGFAPPRLPALRNRIHLQPGRAMLVRGRVLSTADADRRRRLPVPGMFAQGDNAAHPTMTW